MDNAGAKIFVIAAVAFIGYIVYDNWRQPEPAPTSVGPVCCEIAPKPEPAPVVLTPLVVHEPTWVDAIPEFASYRPLPPVKLRRRHRIRRNCK